MITQITRCRLRRLFSVVFMLLIGLSAPLYADYTGFGEAIFLSEFPPLDHKRGHKHRGEDHSEHRAVPMKKLYLNTHDISDDAKVYVMRPDGSMTEGRLSHGDDGWSVSFDTKPMDGSMDGIFNVYVVDKEVVGGTLLVKIAKMNVINHSCGWGHKFKHDKQRIAPKSLNSIPLEIVGYGLWDRNFHTNTMSGDTLRFKVLHHGRPVDAAKVRFKTQTGWMKSLKTDSDGNVSIQIIRDYYPEGWSDFKRRKRGSFLVTAEYESQEKGEFSGKRFNKVKMVSTMPWRYQPQRKEYTSYAYGLSVATLFIVITGIGVYIHRERRKRPYKEISFCEKD